mgnify:CR=1 FL=1
MISGTNEQVLSGQEYNITSQIPYMPWSTFNFQGYRMENEKTTKKNSFLNFLLKMKNLTKLLTHLTWIKKDKSLIRLQLDSKRHKTLISLREKTLARDTGWTRTRSRAMLRPL